MNPEPCGMTPQAAYDDLLRRLREQALLASCSTLLLWDESVCMPPGGVATRGAQLAYLAGLDHALATDPRLGDRLATLAGSSFLGAPDSPRAVNVREATRLYRRQTRIPKALVEEQARVTSFA